MLLNLFQIFYFVHFFVFVKLMTEAVLSLAGGGRRNRTLFCSFIGLLNYLFPLGESNPENCRMGCINSLLQFFILFFFTF